MFIPNLLNCVAFVRSWVDRDFVGKGNRIIENLYMPNLLDYITLMRSWVDRDFVGKGNRIIENLCILLNIVLSKNL